MTVPNNEPTRTLADEDGPDPHLADWYEELAPYEFPFPRYDETGARFVASISEITQTIAQWYVRKNNKYYDVDIPGEELSRDANEKLDEVKGETWIAFWRNAVWVSSGWLWWVWLSHDVANIAVYLPRQLDITLLLVVMAYFTALLFYIFYIQGGPIQKVVLEKTGTRYARSATIINVIYAGVLFYFKGIMSPHDHE